LRGHAKAHLDAIDDIIEKMKDAGVVENARSPWSSNLVVVGRKDENGQPMSPRITIDFRRLNAQTLRDMHPIPHMRDCLKSLDRAAFMSGSALVAPFGDAAATTVPALDGGDGDDYQQTTINSEDPHGADNGQTRRRKRRRGRTIPSLEVTAPGAADEIGDWTPDAIRDAQIRDPDIGPALWWTETGTRPEWTEIEATSPMLRALWQQYASLCVMNGIL